MGSGKRRSASGGRGGQRTAGTSPASLALGGESVGLGPWRRAKIRVSHGSKMAKKIFKTEKFVPAAGHQGTEVAPALRFLWVSLCGKVVRVSQVAKGQVLQSAPVRFLVKSLVKGLPETGNCSRVRMVTSSFHESS